METNSYVSMTDLLEELPGITEEMILELAEENRIPQPISPNTKDVIVKEGDVLFPLVTRDIIRATSRMVLHVERGRWRFDIKDLVSIAINSDVLPFYARLWLALCEHDEFSSVIHESALMLKELHRPTTLEDFEAHCAAQHRFYLLINIADKMIWPAVLNTVSREELEEAVDFLKLVHSSVPLHQRINAERKIRAAEQNLARLSK